MSDVTTNKNYLAAQTFKVTISAKKFANLEYFCTTVALPSITLGPVNMPFRGHQNSVAGEKVEYTPFTMQFQVSENMENYSELFNWILLNSQEDAFQKADIILHILDSSNNVIKQIQFVDAFPTAIGSIQFSTQNADVQYVTCDTSFNYSYFRFLK